MSGRTGHLDALTGIRGLAAWLVVLYHIRLSLTALLPGEVIAALAKGYLAVDLFFMLSGFVIWYNYADRLRAGGGAETRLFLWRRFARVWPLHAAILAAFIAFVALLLATGRPAPGYPLGELPLHLLLMQNWGLTDALTWNHPAWSISTEFAAYLLFPLLVLLRWDRLPVSGLLLLVAVLLTALHLLFSLTGQRNLGDAIPQLGLWRCLAGFALGNVLCLLWQHWRGRSGLALGAGALSLLITGLGLALALPETAFVPAACFTGLLALALGQGKIVQVCGSRALTYLGEISYSTYLSHFLLWIVWKLAFVDATFQLGWASLAGFLATVLAASILLYHGVEKPAQRWLNARPPRWAMRPAAVPAE